MVGSKAIRIGLGHHVDVSVLGRCATQGVVGDPVKACVVGNTVNDAEFTIDMLGTQLQEAEHQGETFASIRVGSVTSGCDPHAWWKRPAQTKRLEHTGLSSMD